MKKIREKVVIAWKSITRQSKNRIVKIAIKFLVLMLVFTILSRVAYGVTLTKVTVSTAESKTIVHQISGAGEVRSNQQLAAGTNLADLIIKTVYVKVGENVEQGGALYQLDENILNEVIELKSNELRAINLQIKELPEISQEVILERNSKQKELNKYIKLKSEGGIIRTPKKAVISTVNAVPGGTASMSDIIFDDISSGVFLEAKFSIDEKEFVKKGAEATVDGTSDGVVISVGDDLDDPTMITAVISLPDDSFDIGEQIDVVIKSESKTNGLCIPREAVHEDGSGVNYVYIVTEIDTVLGVQYKATKLGIDVLDRDTMDAAIEGIDFEQLIIINSTRDVSDGMKVRITEGENDEGSAEME